MDSKEILAKRRDRCIAVILSFKEDFCDEHLPAGLSQEFRKVILDEINEFSQFCIDIARSVADSGIVYNAEYLRKIDEIHRVVTDG